MNTPRRAKPALLGMVLALALSAALVASAGVQPLLAYRTLISGAFGSLDAVGETLLRFAPLAVIALGLAPALRAGLYNVGAPGQLMMGALGATLVSLNSVGLPRPVLLAAGAIAGLVGGLLWGLIPALLRSHLHVNEILSTLAFNAIGGFTLLYLLNGPLRGEGVFQAQSARLPAESWLPTFLPGSRAHIGVLVAVVGLILLHGLYKTTVGYRLRLFGSSPSLARQAGVVEPRLLFLLLVGSAAAAGLAGWMQVAGVDRTLYPNVAAAIGFSGLFVALIGNGRPVGILGTALLFAGLQTGGQSLQVGAGIPVQLVVALQGLLLLVLAMQSFGTRSRSLGSPDA